ncbi:AMP-binding protein [Streptomyces sp. NPDC088354]|uniref:AMP-binding protein n=1 Tax=Streptomyces sp. NPDC088354 TaxID=3365856 RepID=UPI003807316C
MGVKSPPSCPSFATLVEAVRWWSQNEPDRPSFVFLPDGLSESARLSYAQLDREARKVAARLSTSAHPGDRALLCFAPGPDFVVGFLGCLYAGVIAVPVNPPQSSRHLGRLAGIADDCGAAVVLGDATTLATLWADSSEQEPALPRLPVFMVDTTGLGDPDVDWQPGPIVPSDIAFLQYTSGSTAAPKGVMVAHDNLAANVRMLSVTFGMHTDSVVVSWLPTHHDMGLIGSTLMPIWYGHLTVQMPPMVFLRDPIRWLRVVSQYRATLTLAPNFAYEIVARTATPERIAGLDLTCLEGAGNGAEPIRTSTLDLFSRSLEPTGFRRSSFFTCYGLAEATLIVSGRRLIGPDQHDAVMLDRDGLQAGKVILADSDPRALPVVSCGLPRWPQTVAIVEPETGRECSPDEIGEIWLSGPHVARGYWNSPQATAESFGATLPGYKGTFLRTGDLGFVYQGDLFVSGRQKDLVIIFGRKHYPQDIETTVARHRQVRPSGCVAFSLERGNSEGVGIVAEIVGRHQRDDLVPLAEAIAQDVRREHDVSAFQVVLVRPGSLPKTSSGKVRRRYTRDLLLQGELAEILRWPARSRASDESAVHEGSAYSADGQRLPLAVPGPARLPRTVDDVLEFVRSEVAAVMELDVSAVETATPMGNIGLDSLGMTLLRTRLFEITGVTLAIESLRDQTPHDVAQNIFRTTMARAISRSVSPEPQDDGSYDQGAL